MLFVFILGLFNFAYCLQLKPLEFMFKPSEQTYNVDDPSAQFDTKLQLLDDKVHRRFSNQIGFVIERIEHLESIVSYLTQTKICQ